jgi:hypothetical protein
MDPPYWIMWSMKVKVRRLHHGRQSNEEISTDMLGKVWKRLGVYRKVNGRVIYIYHMGGIWRVPCGDK